MALSLSQNGDEFEEVRAGLTELQRRMTRIENSLAEQSQPVGYFDVKAALDTVQAITHEVFGSGATFTECEDWEVPDDRYIDVHVQVGGEIEEILSRMTAWHQRVTQLDPKIRGLFRLSIE